LTVRLARNKQLLSLVSSREANPAKAEIPLQPMPGIAACHLRVGRLLECFHTKGFELSVLAGHTFRCDKSECEKACQLKMHP
jgi:hypothetical protein